MINKNPQTDIGAQPKDHKSKEASHWHFLLPHTEYGKDPVR